MPKPTWFDWITVAALVLGPVLALFAQRGLDLLRERKKKRLDIYLTVMSMRALWIHPDSLKAHNLIDTIFDAKGDKPIRDAWSAVIAHVTTRRPQDDEGAARWDSRLVDLRVDLYQVMGKAVGYNHTVDYIKTQIYAPEYHATAEMEWLQIRKQLAKAITDHGIKVVVTESAPLAPQLPPGPAPRVNVPIRR